MIHSRDITYNLHKVVFLLDKIADKALEQKLEITFSQFKILMAIDGEEVCQKTIADYWDMTEAAVSRQIDLLVAKKIINRKENAENRRQHMLSLTKTGKQQLKSAIKLIDQKYEEIFQVIDQKERA